MDLITRFFISDFRGTAKMDKRRYYIYSVTVAAVVVFVLSIICVLSPDREYSVSERRKLAKLPTVSAEGKPSAGWASAA